MSWKDMFPKENRYFETENGILYTADAIKTMSKFPENIFDTIITDPPYGTTACKWDTIIPFDKMWSQLKRVRKDRSAVVLFGSEPFSSYLRISNIKEFKYDWYWKKKNAPNYPHAKNMPLKIIENILVFSNGKIGHKSQLQTKRMVYNPQGLQECNYIIKRNRGKTNENLYIRPSHKGIQIVTKQNYPKNLLEYDYDYKQQMHPTQKPIALLEYLIKTYTNENDLVLDFTCGSGSTLVACENTNRRWIGIELNPEYCEITKQRILGDKK